MVEWIFVATDTAFKGIDFDDATKKFKRMNAAKIENIPADELNKYTPLCLFYMVGETDEIKRKITSITKIKGGYEAKGFVFKGRPIPQKFSYLVGESFSFPTLFTAASDVLAKPIVTEIITTEDGVINYVQSLQAKMGRQVKLAEQTYAAEQYKMESEAYSKTMENLAEKLSMPKWLRKPY